MNIGRREMLTGLAAGIGGAAALPLLSGTGWTQKSAVEIFGTQFEMPTLGLTREQLARDPLTLEIPEIKSDLDIVFGLERHGKRLPVVTGL